MPDLFAALARKRLNREALLDKTRLVLAEKEKEMAEKEKEVAEKEKEVAEKEKEVIEAQAELKVTTFRLQGKNMDALRLANSVNLRGAIGKCRGQSCVHGAFSLSLPFYNHTYIHRVIPEKRGFASSWPQAQDAIDACVVGPVFACKTGDP